MPRRTITTCQTFERHTGQFSNLAAMKTQIFHLFNFRIYRPTRDKALPLAGLVQALTGNVRSWVKRNGVVIFGHQMQSGICCLERR